MTGQTSISPSSRNPGGRLSGDLSMPGNGVHVNKSPFKQSPRMQLVTVYFCTVICDSKSRLNASAFPALSGCTVQFSLLLRLLLGQNQPSYLALVKVPHEKGMAASGHSGSLCSKLR